MIGFVGGLVIGAVRRIAGRIMTALGNAIDDLLVVALLAGAGLLVVFLPQLEPVRQWLSDVVPR